MITRGRAGSSQRKNAHATCRRGERAERSISRSFPLISANSGRALGASWGLNGHCERRSGGVLSGFEGQMSGFGRATFAAFGRGHGMVQGLGGGLDLGRWLTWYGQVKGAGKRGDVTRQCCSLGDLVYLAANGTRPVIAATKMLRITRCRRAKRLTPSGRGRYPVLATAFLILTESR